MSHDVERQPSSSALAVATMGFLATLGIDGALAGTSSWSVRLLADAGVGVAVALAIQLAIVRPLHHRLVTERFRRAAVEAEVAELRELQHFGARLDAAVSVAGTEPEVLAVIGRAITQLLPQRDNSLLLAPPTETRITWAIPTTESGLGEPTASGMGVRCSALGAGHTTAFTSSVELDACPHMAARDLEISGVCVPVLVSGGHLGVLHSAGPAGDLPAATSIAALEHVARTAGLRIDALRQGRIAHEPIALDPLTGLPNQNVVHRRVRDLLNEQVPFSLALCDVDAFAAYNDEHGAEVGDVALRVYAELLGVTLRPGDVAARSGGDKFLCVFPNCAAENARAAMERVRESLVLDLAMHELAPFTVSVGICHSSQADYLEALVEIGDVALAVAKNLGGNRVCLDDFALDAHIIDD